MRALLPSAVVTLISLATACGGKTEDGANSTGSTRTDDGTPGSGSHTPAEGGSQSPDSGTTDNGGTSTDGGGPAHAPASNDPSEEAPSSGTTSVTPAPAESSKPPDSAMPSPVTFGPPPADTPAPMGCGDATRTGSNGSCELDLGCSNDNLSSSCVVQPDGTFACSCSSNAAYGNYVLAGVDDTNACEHAVELCKGGTGIDFAADAGCQDPTVTQATGSCQLLQQCASSANVSDTVTAIWYDTHYSYCSDLGDGRLNCSCSTSAVSREYTLTGQGLDTACQAGMELCTGGMPMFEPSPGCTVTAQSDTKSDCQLQQQCEDTAPVGDGVAAVSDNQTSTCTADSDDTWSCSCSTATRSLTFQLSAEQAAEDRCATVLGLCTDAAAPEPFGEIDCETTSQDASDDNCSTQVTCTQQATAGDFEIELTGIQATSCQRTGDGPWTCGCSSGSEAVTYDVEGDDGWAACTAASAACSERVPVSIGAGAK